MRPSLSPRLAPLLAPLCALVLGLGASPAGAIGLLVPTEPGLPSLDLVYHRVEVEVTERGATTKVTQEFENKTGRQLEATYLFPMPEGATVDEFALWMNGKRQTGKVLERGQARAIYESIVRRARDPGLIEYVDSELFQARVFPIPPKGRQKVELTYSHLVGYDGGTHRYVYPLKTDAKASRTLEDFTLTVNVKSKLPIRNLYSPTHRIAGKTRGQSAVASFEKSAASLDEDFVLYWQVADEDVGLTVLSTKEEGEAGYYLLLASPKDGFRDKEIVGKRVSFVVDTSGSMAGPKMESTQKALRYCVDQLGEDDLFNVITFGGYVELFRDEMVSASGRNKGAARAFIDAIDPLGGTNIDDALKTALEKASGSDKVPHMIVFLTDGRPTIGVTDPGQILGRVNKRNDHDARVFVLGVGEDVNTVLLDRLAEENGGTELYVDAESQAIEEQIPRFYDKIAHPVLSDLKLRTQGVRTFGEHPRALRDLFAGGQLVVLGRYRKGGDAKVTLTGRTPQGRRTFAYRTTFADEATEHSFLPRLWAQRQVGTLLAAIREKGERPGLVAEVTQLATRFGIVTPYTSYLVVEPGAQRSPVPRPGDRPLPGRPGPVVDGFAGGSGDLGAFAPEADAEMERAPARRSGVGSGGGRATAKAKKGARSRRILREESGEGAVAAAKEIGRLKRATQASERKVATSMTRALGRTFRYQGGFFVDEKIKSKDKTLVVKPYSDAFFEVLRRRPDLKQALALGERVKVKVGKGRALVISPEGAETIADEELKRFLRR